MFGFVTACNACITRATGQQRESVRRISRQRDGGVGSAVALNRVLFEEKEVGEHGVVVVPKQDHRAAHVHEVLRLPRAGGTVRAGVVDRFLVDNVPVTIHEDASVKFDLTHGTRRQLPEAPAVSLLLAVPRPKVLARLLPQIAAIGVRDIVLCNAYKVEKCYFDSTLLTCPGEMRTLLLNGIAQSGNDSRLPRVTIEKRLKVFLEDRLKRVAPPHANLLIAEPGSELSMFETLERLKLERLKHEHSAVAASSAEQFSPHCNEPSHIVLAVGPEGGWMPREVSMCEHDFRFNRVALGDRILRTDAAVLILLGLAHEYIRFTNRR